MINLTRLKKNSSRILCQVKISFKTESDIKTFLGGQKQKVYFQQTWIMRNVKRGSSRERKMIPDTNLVPYKWMKKASNGKYMGKYERGFVIFIIKKITF